MAARIALCVMGLFLALIVARLLNGKISTRGMLSSGNGGRPQAERVQSMYFSLAAVLLYGAQSLRDGQLADPPPLALAALGASQIVYLLGKFLRH